MCQGNLRAKYGLFYRSMIERWSNATDDPPLLRRITFFRSVMLSYCNWRSLTLLRWKEVKL